MPGGVTPDTLTELCGEGEPGWTQFRWPEPAAPTARLDPADVLTKRNLLFSLLKCSKNGCWQLRYRGKLLIWSANSAHRCFLGASPPATARLCEPRAV